MTALRALRDRGGAAWTRLSLRERLLVGALGMILVAYLAVTQGLQPLLAARAAAQADIARHEAALARIEAAPEPGAAPALSDGPVSAVLTETAPEFGLAIRRIEPEGGGARLTLEDVEFAAVLLWLEELERAHGVRTVSVEMDRRPEPGVVTARLGLAR